MTLKFKLIGLLLAAMGINFNRSRDCGGKEIRFLDRGARDLCRFFKRFFIHRSRLSLSPA
jgi:hypothetical protein